MAVVTCMDARLDPWRFLGLARGEATVIRNAGGVVTDDVVRSLVVSQRVLGSREIMVIHHTHCGMSTLSEPAITQEVEQETGLRLPFALETFADAFAEVRQSLRRLEQTAYLVKDCVARGFVYDLDSDELFEAS